MNLRMRLYRRSNGWWYYEIRRNRPRSLNTRDESAARALYKIIKRELLAGRLAQLDGDRRITLAQFKTKFFANHIDIADDTRAAYELAFKLLIDALGGSTIMGRIDQSHIAKFKSICRARGMKRVSINTYLRHIRAIFNKAHGWSDIENKLPIEFFKLPPKSITWPGPMCTTIWLP
jgi:hypothetical protein